MTDVEALLVETLETAAEAAIVTFTVDEVVVATTASEEFSPRRHRYPIAVAAAVLLLVASWVLLRPTEPSATVATTPPTPETEAPPDISDLQVPGGVELVGRIEVEAIDLSWDLRDGVDAKTLRLGPGRYRGTAKVGEAGNVAIAGHRTTWGAPFGRLDELSVGDEIRISTGQQRFVYVVIGQPDGQASAIVEPSDTSVVADSGSALLTLTTHTPEFSARQRLIVQAELIGEPTGPSSADPDAADQLEGLP